MEASVNAFVRGAELHCVRLGSKNWIGSTFGQQKLDVQAKLKLSAEQQGSWLSARRSLLEQLSVIRAQRDKFALSLGLFMLQNGQVLVL